MNARTYSYATWHDRLLAYLIDQLGVLLVGTFATAMLVMVGIIHVAGTAEEPVIDQSATLVVFLALAAYHVISTGGRWQATPGQRVMAIHVVRVDGKRLMHAQALERFLAYVLPMMPIYTSFLPEQSAKVLVVWLTIFWFAPILFTPERMGMHDRLCRTRVVAGRV